MVGPAFVVANLVIANLSLILVYRVGEEIILEICWYVIVLIGIMGLMCMFVIINTRISKANIDQSVRLFEFEQYKDMFNSLQEGVIVLDKPADGESTRSVFFVNELMQTAMNKILESDSSLEASHKAFENIQTNFSKPIMHVYRSEQQRNSQQETDPQKKYSFQDVVGLTQAQLSKMVFTFRDSE